MGATNVRTYKISRVLRDAWDLFAVLLDVDAVQAK